MTLWQRVRRALGGKPPGLALSGEGADSASWPAGVAGGTLIDREAQSAEVINELPPDERYLEGLLHEVRGPRAGASGRDLHAAIDRLVRGGQERRAIEFLGRFASVLTEDDELLLRLAELLCARPLNDGAGAESVLRRVLALPAPQMRRHRAHFLLSEVLLLGGDREGASRELSAILADDLLYPRARRRLAEIEERAGQKGRRGPAGPAGGIGQGLPTLLGAKGIRHQRYQLLRELGRGSAGTVYLAQDTELSRELAIKVFYLGRTSAEAMARAWNEARLTAAVRHAGVVALYELDVERNLMVMELCTGGTLRQRLQNNGRLPAEIAMGRTLELLDTLATVHRTGVVHGDLKPGNLLFRGPGRGRGAGTAAAATEEDHGDLVIADFGTARLYSEAPDGDHGDATGTLGYFPPERRKAPGVLLPSADLYAVGAILLEMLLGGLPLPRWGMLRGDRLPTALPEEVAPGPLRPLLEGFLERLLAENPAERPTAAAAHRLLGELCYAVPLFSRP